MNQFYHECSKLDWKKSLSTKPRQKDIVTPDYDFNNLCSDKFLMSIWYTNRALNILFNGEKKLFKRNNSIYNEENLKLNVRKKYIISLLIQQFKLLRQQNSTIRLIDSSQINLPWHSEDNSMYTVAYRTLIILQKKIRVWDEVKIIGRWAWIISSIRFNWTLWLKQNKGFITPDNVSWIINKTNNITEQIQNKSKDILNIDYIREIKKNLLKLNITNIIDFIALRYSQMYENISFNNQKEAIKLLYDLCPTQKIGTSWRNSFHKTKNIFLELAPLLYGSKYTNKKLIQLEILKHHFSTIENNNHTLMRNDEFKYLYYVFTDNNLPLNIYKVWWWYIGIVEFNEICNVLKGFLKRNKHLI